MFDVGFWEITVIGIVALVIVGPERLPGLARTVGLWVGKARRMIADVKRDIDREIKASDMPAISKVKNELDKVKKTVDTTANSIASDTSIASTGLADTAASVTATAKPARGSDVKSTNEANQMTDDTRYYIYENLVHNRAIIHKATCAYVKGRQNPDAIDQKRNEWHGPFDNLTAAKNRQQTMPVNEKKECGNCMKPRRDLL